MKAFELAYLSAEPFLLPLWRRVRTELLEIARSGQGKVEILDVGGRKSHYTIGVPALISVSDIPRKTETQKKLHLGADNGIARQLLQRRSNIRWYLYDDMTKSSVKSGTFDCVVAVEVLEHVERDADFISEVSRVLKPGGTFLMTTPNGDFVPNVNNPDHKRHYTRQQLETVLSRCFSQVHVEYAIRGGVFRRLGLRSWSPMRPMQTVLSMAGNVINQLQSVSKSTGRQARGTHHLVAYARKVV